MACFRYTHWIGLKVNTNDQCTTATAHLTKRVISAFEQLIMTSLVQYLQKHYDKPRPRSLDQIKAYLQRNTTEITIVYFVFRNQSSMLRMRISVYPGSETIDQNVVRNLRNMRNRSIAQTLTCAFYGSIATSSVYSRHLWGGNLPPPKKKIRNSPPKNYDGIL